MLLAFQASWSLILECCCWNALHAFFSAYFFHVFSYLSVNLLIYLTGIYHLLRFCSVANTIAPMQDHLQQPVNWGSGSLVLRCLNELLQRALLPAKPQIWLASASLRVMNQWSIVDETCIYQVGRRWTAIKKLEALGPLVILQFQSWGCPYRAWGVSWYLAALFSYFPPEASSINATISCWLLADLCPASFVTVSALVTLQACRRILHF